MMMPILYTVLTTICAFLSLIFSGIKPIIDFWMDDDFRIVGLNYGYLSFITFFIKTFFPWRKKLKLKIQKNQ